VFSDYVYNQPVSLPWYLPIYENGEWKFSDCIGRTLDRARFEEWKTKYYELEGWDTNSGWVTRSTLESVDLGKVAEELQRKGRLGGQG
jgi:aldehyde:ferredoxin oxidoreductase